MTNCCICFKKINSKLYGGKHGHPVCRKCFGYVFGGKDKNYWWYFETMHYGGVLFHDKRWVEICGRIEECREQPSLH